MIFSVGLTGNIASGKTTVAKIFSDLGIKVLNADQISRELSSRDSTAYNKIVEHFSSSILLENKELNRRLLRDIIFNNPDERLWLENLLHPVIREELERQINLCKTDYCVVEIPLLIDRKNYPYLNRILLVTAPLEVQIERVKKRDNCSKEQALAILSAQPDMEQRLKNADDIITNDAGFDRLKKTVIDLHIKYMEEANIDS